jgi:hypothetical protein
MLGNPPSLDLGARRETITSPGRVTRVRPTASRRVSGEEAVNAGYNGEHRLLCQPHGLRCEFSYYLCRHMLLSTIKCKHTHIEAYTHMSEKTNWEKSVICNGCLKCSGSTEHWWNYTDRGKIEIPSLLPMNTTLQNHVYSNPNPKPQSTELYIINSKRN